MKLKPILHVALPAVVIAGGISLAAAQDPQGGAAAPAGAGRGAPAITLGPDDKPAFPDPPPGFNAARDGIPHGRLTSVEYDSKTLGTRRRITVYTPPGYSTGRKYAVIYLLHGLGWNDLEWTQQRHADIVVDNLIADRKIQPVILVFPNGDSAMTAEAIAAAGGEAWMGRGGAPGAAAVAPRGGAARGLAGFESWGTPFENDLLKDIIPLVEARYSVYADRDHRALAGLSMGGGQALNIGLVHPETFAWIGGFSSAPDTKAPPDLVPDPEVPKRLKLVWLACGNKDGLIRISQGVHTYLKEKGVPHVWHVDGNAHDTPEWQNNLYWFAQHLFK